jgi:hypothetical protein
LQNKTDLVTIQQMQVKLYIYISFFLLFLVKLRGGFVGSAQNNQPKRIFDIERGKGGELEIWRRNDDDSFKKQ